MKSYMDAARIKRRAAWSNAASVGGMLLLLISLLLPYLRAGLTGVFYLLMPIGLVVSMVGIYFANRWVKRPRPETVLDEALKGLSDSHQLFHYALPAADHVLLTPGGVLVIETVNLEGAFTYRAGKWRERMNLGRSLRWIVEEHLGDPIRAARSSAESLHRLLGEDVPVRAVVVFTHPRAVLDVENNLLPVVAPAKLKKYAGDKGPRLPAETHARVQAILMNQV